MTPSRIDTYLEALASELCRRGIDANSLVEEAREHLADAVGEARQRGLSTGAAEHEALARLGTPALVAECYTAGRFRVLNRIVFVLAVVTGIAIAYVDSRPHWDDAGITVFAMMVSAAVFGLIAPRKPWLWALAVGMWIPAHAMARTLSPGSVVMLVVLAFPLVGAYAGALARRVITP